MRTGSHCYRAVFFFNYCGVYPHWRGDPIWAPTPFLVELSAQPKSHFANILAGWPAGLEQEMLMQTVYFDAQSKTGSLSTDNRGHHIQSLARLTAYQGKTWKARISTYCLPSAERGVGYGVVQPTGSSSALCRTTVLEIVFKAVKRRYIFSKVRQLLFFIGSSRLRPALLPAY